MENLLKEIFNSIFFINIKNFFLKKNDIEKHLIIIIYKFNINLIMLHKNILNKR